MQTEQKPTQAEGKGNEPKPITADEVAELVNKAITGHLDRALKKQPKSLTAEDLEGWWAKREAEREERERQIAAQRAVGPEVNEAIEAANKAYSAKLDKLKAALETERQKFADIERKAQETADHEALLAAVQQGGFDGNRARILGNHLRAAGLVRRTEAGLVFVQGDDEIDLKEGVSAWLKTSAEAKEFAPSGKGNETCKSAPGGPATAAELKTRAGEALLGLRGGELPGIIRARRYEEGANTTKGRAARALFSHRGDK